MGLELSLQLLTFNYTTLKSHTIPEIQNTALCINKQGKYIYCSLQQNTLSPSQKVCLFYWCCVCTVFCLFKKETVVTGEIKVAQNTWAFSTCSPQRKGHELWEQMPGQEDDLVLHVPVFRSVSLTTVPAVLQQSPTTSAWHQTKSVKSKKILQIHQFPKSNLQHITSPTMREQSS